MIYRVRISGTISDEIEVEVAGPTAEDEVREIALMAWRYVEYQDLEATDVQLVTPHEELGSC